MTFGERLQSVLDAQGINRAELCRRTGLKSSNLVPYMKKDSERSPKLSTAVLIANALGVSVDYLAGLTDDPAPKFHGNVQPDAVAVSDDGTAIVYQVKGSDVRALVDDYGQCTPERRRMLASLARDLRDQSKETGEDSASLDKAVNE